MKERVTGILSGEHGQSRKPRSTVPAPYIGTFHSLGARILRSECRTFGRDPNFVIFDDHDSFDLIKKAAKVVLAPKSPPALFAQKISALKNLDRSAAEAGLDAKKKEELGRIFDLY